MMLACLDRGSRTLASVRSAETFAINVLAAGQEELARRFSSKDPEASKWEGVEWEEREGRRACARSLIWLRCELRDLIDGGDHLIVTGSVLDAEKETSGEPLVFYRGGYLAGLGLSAGWPHPRSIQRTYLLLLLGNTLAASFIWGINTIFLLDAGLSNLEAFAANAFFTAGMVLFEVPTGIVADTVGRRAPICSAR